MIYCNVTGEDLMFGDCISDYNQQLSLFQLIYKNDFFFFFINIDFYTSFKWILSDV